MAIDDDISDLMTRRASKKEAAGDDVEGYAVTANGGNVDISFIVGDEEYTISMPREHARRFGKRVCVAAQRSLVWQRSTSS